MASYSSYKPPVYTGTTVQSGAVTQDRMSSDVRQNYCVKWFYGTPNPCTGGCCCLFTVPSDVRRLKWEIWGAGGNGSGACSCDRCQHYMGAGGGTYNTKSIDSTTGCQYTVCAGGVYPCYSRECNGCNGCTTYVNGFNLSGFCACGGGAGYGNSSWTDGCFSYMDSCRAPGDNNGEFATYTMMPNWAAAGGYQYPGDACHCWKRNTWSNGAPFLDAGRNDQFLNECWIRCGCFGATPYAMGGQNGQTTYCGSGHCGQGGTGGSGVVKLTYF